MPAREASLLIDKFRGVNRRDGSDLVGSNEFYTLQNWFHKSKGLLYKRQGTTEDLNVSTFTYEDQILGFHRHVDTLGAYSTLYYCQSDEAVIAQPTTAPTLTDITSATGDIFNGGAAAAVEVSYSWVGRGYETQARSGYATITPAANTNKVRVAVPTFPAGVDSANIFMRTGGSYPAYVGTIRSTGSTFDITAYLGPPAATADALGTVTVTVGASGSGSLKKGTYYVSMAWYCDPTTNNHMVVTTTPSSNPIAANEYAIVNVPYDDASLTVQNVKAADSTNGASWCYVFIGVKPPTQTPSICMGLIKRKAAADAVTANNTMTITSIYKKINAMCAPCFNVSGSAIQVQFYTYITLNDYPTTAGRVIIKDADGTYRYLYWPNTYYKSFGGYDGINPLTARTVTTAEIGNVRLAKIATSGTPYFASFLGLAFIANGKNLLLQTDGYSVAEIYQAWGTTLPGFASQVVVFKNQLVVSVSAATSQAPPSTNVNQSQIYGSNALNPYNWASGGSGTALRYATIGDPFGDGVKAIGVLSFTSSTSGPTSYILAFKKSSSYVLSGIPDLTSSVPSSMDVLSARVGCLAPRSIVNTPVGTVFAGQDGDIYVVAGSGEPKRIGTKVKSIIESIVGNDTLMALMTACYHDNHYKLSYASSTSQTANNAQLWADLRLEEGEGINWSGPHTGIDVAQQLVFSADGDNGNRYALDGPGAQIMLMDDTSTFQDLGTTISSVVRWKTSRFGMDRNLKRYMSIFFDLYYDTTYAHSILVEGFADENYGSCPITLSSAAGTWNSSSWDTGLWGDAQYFAVNAFFSPTNLVGRTLAWQMTHAKNAQMIMASANVLFRPERRRIA